MTVCATQDIVGQTEDRARLALTERTNTLLDLKRVEVVQMILRIRSK
jgi:hypothetical protein